MDALIEHLNVVVFGLTVVFAWGAFRAGGVRDDEGRKLPPSVFSSIYLGLIYAGLYLGLLVLAYSAPGLVQEDGWTSLIPLAESLAQEGQLPLLMLILMYGAHSIPQVKDLERALVIRMHAINDRSAEQRELREYFVRCGYKPSEQAAERHMEFLRRYDIHLTEREPAEIGLGAANSWGKVTSLLELLDEHVRDVDTTFSSEEKDQIRRLGQAHRRKTELATHLFHMIEQMDAQPAHDAQLSRVTGMLSETPRQDRAGVAVAESMANEILRDAEMARARGAAPAESGVEVQTATSGARVPAVEIRRYAAAVENYFSAEYELLLEEASLLAAKAIARAGDHSDRKMMELKAAGFRELGRIQQVNIDRLMMVVLTALIAPLAIYYFIGEQTGVGTTRPAILVTVALTLAVSVFVAAISGTRRKLAQAPETPWRAYFAAGFVGMLCAIAIFAGRQAIRESEQREAFRQKVLEIMSPDGEWRNLSAAGQQALFERSGEAVMEQATALVRIERLAAFEDRAAQRATKSTAAAHWAECRTMVFGQSGARRLGATDAARPVEAGAAPGSAARSAPGAASGSPTGSAPDAARPSLGFWTRTIPWSAGSFVVVLTICWLIRQPSWSVARGSAIGERVVDGAVLGAAYGLTALGTFKAFSIMGSRFGALIDCTYAQGFWDVPAILFLRSALVGFVIGVAVIRDLREVASARVIDDYVSRRGRRIGGVIGHA